MKVRAEARPGIFVPVEGFFGMAHPFEEPSNDQDRVIPAPVDAKSRGGIRRICRVSDDCVQRGGPSQEFAAGCRLSERPERRSALRPMPALSTAFSVQGCGWSDQCAGLVPTLFCEIRPEP